MNSLSWAEARTAEAKWGGVRCCGLVGIGARRDVVVWAIGNRNDLPPSAGTSWSKRTNEWVRRTPETTANPCESGLWRTDGGVV